MEEERIVACWGMFTAGKAEVESKPETDFAPDDGSGFNFCDLCGAMMKCGKPRGSYLLDHETASDLKLFEKNGGNPINICMKCFDELKNTTEKLHGELKEDKER